MNGYKFHTKGRSKNLNTQNCRVMVEGDAQSGGKDYLRVLLEIIELEYDSCHKVVLFRCEWYDVFNENVGLKTEGNWVTSVNVKRFFNTNEPYVLDCQVEQVYYVKDNIHRDWRVVIKTNPHNFYDIPDEDEEGTSFWDNDEIVKEAYIPEINDSRLTLVRDNVEFEMVDANIISQELLHQNKRGEGQLVEDADDSDSSGKDDMPLFGDKPHEEPHNI